MRLVDKLRRIAAPAPSAPALSPALRGARPAALPGERVEGEFGSFWVRRTSLPLDHVHGGPGERGSGEGLTLAELRTTPVGRLAAVAREPRLAEVDFSRAIFFDTETTSLGGGVSTYVFLLGAGYFDGDHFVVEQYFLHDVPDERALLHAINERLQGFALAVSFHGKGFDAPRLSGRLAFHHMGLSLPEPHLDLCLVGRSLYRGAFGNCRLQTFERRLVDFHRADDLPGAECPRAFFSHLRGDSSMIPRVFEHNLLDVLTLPALAYRFAGELAAPTHPVVLSNLGSFHESTGDDAEARSAYEAALPGLRAGQHSMLARTLERLALLERRIGRHAESAALLHERLRLPPWSLQPWEDLAKYYEHRVRDYAAAEAVTTEACSMILTGKIQIDSRSRVQALRALRHRLGRVRRRVLAQPR